MDVAIASGTPTITLDVTTVPVVFRAEHVRTDHERPPNVRVMESGNRAFGPGDRVVHEHRDDTFVPLRAGDGPAELTPPRGSGGKKSSRKKKNLCGQSDAVGDSPADESIRRATERREAERLAELGRYKNSTVVLVCVDEKKEPGRMLYPTRDPYDSAHGTRVGHGVLAVLVPNATFVGNRVVRTAGAVPRRYPAEQMTSRGVAFDSAFDATYEAQCFLDGIPGIGIQDNTVTIGSRRSMVVAAMVNQLGRDGARNALRPRTTQGKYTVPK